MLLCFFVSDVSITGSPAMPFKPDLTFAFQLVNQPVDLLAIEMYDPSDFLILEAKLASFGAFLKYAQHAGLGRLPVDAAVAFGVAWDGKPSVQVMP